MKGTNVQCVTWLHFYNGSDVLVSIKKIEIVGSGICSRVEKT